MCDAVDVLLDEGGVRERHRGEEGQRETGQAHLTSGGHRNIPPRDGTHETMLSTKHVANVHRILRDTIEDALNGL